MKNISIKHKEIGIIIHADTVGRDGARTLCGEDTAIHPEKLGYTTEKITCPHCVELIVGIHRFFKLSDLNIKTISKSESVKKWIYELANK